MRIPNRHTTTLLRNTNRRLISEVAKAQRKNRSDHRRKSNGEKRPNETSKKGGRTKEGNTTNERVDNAQELRAVGNKYSYGRDLLVATLNMRGARQ